MNKTFFDKLAMLLSTDWFFPWWPSIGLLISYDDKKVAQNKCRDEVKVFTRNFDNYWIISFDDVRIEHTSRHIIDTIKEYVYPGFMLFDLVNNGGTKIEPNSQKIPLDLIGIMTELLVSDRNSIEFDLPEDVCSIVTYCWKKSEEEDIDYSALCRSGRGEWDQIISNLTPDLPCMTADFVSIDIDSHNRIARFCGLINSKLTGQSMHLLTDWYENFARELTGSAMTAPL